MSHAPRAGDGASRRPKAVSKCARERAWSEGWKSPSGMRSPACNRA